MHQGLEVVNGGLHDRPPSYTPLDPSGAPPSFTSTPDTSSSDAPPSYTSTPTAPTATAPTAPAQTASQSPVFRPLTGEFWRMMDRETVDFLEMVGGTIVEWLSYGF